MPAFLNNDVYDSGLSVLDTATATLHICSQQPASLAEVTTYTLGNKSGISIGAPTAHTTGRKVVVAAITGGTVSGTGAASHYAIVDGTRLLAANTLGASQGVTSGNTFSLGAIDIAIPAPV